MDANSSLEVPCMHPKAYRFFPLKQQEKLGFNKKDGKRIYFYGQIEHDDYQKKKLAQFKEYYQKKHGKPFESDYFDDQKLVLFLCSYHYKNDATLEAMKAHLQFRSKYVVNEQGIKVIRTQTDEKVKMLVQRGFFYLTGRDKNFRPIIVFNMEKIDFKDADLNLRAIVFVQEFVIENLFIPGQVQNWNIIYNLCGMGITDVPATDLKNNLQIISANYGGRLYKLWMLNSPATIYFSWKIVKNFLDPVTVDKITIVKKNTDDSIWKEIDKSQIEKKYGGTQPDRTQFYPFKIPPAVFFENKIISEEKYEEMYQTGKLTGNELSPSLKQKFQLEKKKVEEVALKEQMVLAQNKEKVAQIPKEVVQEAQEKKVEEKATEEQKPEEKKPVEQEMEKKD